MTTLPLCLPIDFLIDDSESAAWEFLNASELVGIQYWSPSLESDALWRDKHCDQPYLATRLKVLAPRLSERQASQAEALARWLTVQRERQVTHRKTAEKAKATKAKKATVSNA